MMGDLEAVTDPILPPSPCYLILIKRGIKLKIPQANTE